MPDITIGASLVSGVTALFTLYTWLLTRNANFYSTFDTLYQDMLKLGLEHPLLRDTAKTLTYDHSHFGGELRRYETYAFMMLNVCETIADSLHLYGASNRRLYTLIERAFCLFLPSIADLRDLKRTWEPVLREEAHLHGSWIKGRKEDVQFKKKF